MENVVNVNVKHEDQHRRHVSREGNNLSGIWHTQEFSRYYSLRCQDLLCPARANRTQWWAGYYLEGTSQLLLQNSPHWFVFLAAFQGLHTPSFTSLWAVEWVT